jgi:hypothetical protein
MGGEYNAYRKINSHKILVAKTRRIKKTLGKPRIIWEYNIKTALKEPWY